MTFSRHLISQDWFLILYQADDSPASFVSWGKMGKSHDASGKYWPHSGLSYVSLLLTVDHKDTKWHHAIMQFLQAFNCEITILNDKNLTMVIFNEHKLYFMLEENWLQDFITISAHLIWFSVRGFTDTLTKPPLILYSAMKNVCPLPGQTFFQLFLHICYTNYQTNFKITIEW